MDRPPLLDVAPWSALLASLDADSGSCAAHKAHHPRNLTVQPHYIWPLGMQGPEEDWNIVMLCPTGHANVHLLLRSLHMGIEIRGGHKEKYLARIGYALWTYAGQPGGGVAFF